LQSYHRKLLDAFFLNAFLDEIVESSQKAFSSKSDFDDELKLFTGK